MYLVFDGDSFLWNDIFCWWPRIGGSQETVFQSAVITRLSFLRLKSPHLEQGQSLWRVSLQKKRKKMYLVFLAQQAGVIKVEIQG